MFNWSNFIRPLIAQGKIRKGMTYLELNAYLQAAAHKLIPSRSKYIKFTLIYGTIRIVFNRQERILEITEELLT